MVAVYCQGMIPGLWAFMYVLVVMKAMQSQNVMQPAAFVTIAMFFINIGINWAMIRVWGFAGAAFAQSASRILWMVLMIGTHLP
jgi:MATE family multidrug resistance protein